ncbi:hypothetical protein WD174_005068 [Salmonella enterica]|nr:hypothetical protein [Salmonella enterica]
MKKNMAGQGVAGALLLTGLMVSAGAMAASGDPVQGGSGTVTINVPIVTSTCSVSVPTEVNFDPINKNSLRFSGLIASRNLDVAFSNCKDKTLQMSVQTTLNRERSSAPLLAVTRTVSPIAAIRLPAKPYS